MPRIDLDKARNPEYFAIIERHNVIMAEWNRLNRTLHEFKVKKVFPFYDRKKLIPIVEDGQALQAQFLQWNRDAYELIKKPALIPMEGADGQTSFLHYMSLLRDIRNRLNSDMELLVQNFDRVKSSITNQVNFVIAIVSFFASFGGLVVSLIALWTSK